jgi:hypothetical protein
MEASISKPVLSFEPQISQSLAYLVSDEAVRSIELDPYWPKWNSPWWHMMLLREMGLSKQIPARAIETLLGALKGYIPFFPRRLEDVPEGRDALADVMCHCQMGCVYQLLQATGVAIDKELPWFRPWFIDNQLPDGGFNCDEAAYTRAVPRSSVVSTVPMLEALLSMENRTEAESAILDKGAEYLLKRQLMCSLSKGDAIIDPAWAQLTFPRFYEYDILRGLVFVLNWALARSKPIKLSSIAKVLGVLNEKPKPWIIERQIHVGKKTRRKSSDGKWTAGLEASLFPLLEAVSELGAVSPFLEQLHEETIFKLESLDRKGLLFMSGGKQ